MKFSDKLAKQRKANNLSQEQLAEQLGVTRQSVSKWESGDSYPDMAKIIQICKILNCTLNDIMDDGVIPESYDSKEKKEEKENNLKKVLDDFLNFITRSVNMFFQMSFKSKLTLIIEMAILIIILSMLTNGINSMIMNVIKKVIFPLPDKTFYYVRDIFNSLILSALTILSIIICVHVFKIRYLDYYVTLTDKNATTQTIEEPIEENKGPAFKQEKERVVVIRDPEHSQSKFVDGLVSMFTILFKLLLTSIFLPIIPCFIFFVGAIIFCLIKKGLVFKTGAIMAIGAAIICAIIIVFIYNVLFNRKQPYKTFIIGIVVGFIIAGIGSGLFFDCVSKFTVLTNLDNIQTTKEVMTLHDINENDEIYFASTDVEYVIDEEKENPEIELIYPANTKIVNNFYHLENSKEYYFHLKYDVLSLNMIFDDLSKNQIHANIDYDDLLKVKVTCNSNDRMKFKN